MQPHDWTVTPVKTVIITASLATNLVVIMWLYVYGLHGGVHAYTLICSGVGLSLLVLSFKMDTHAWKGDTVCEMSEKMVKGIRLACRRKMKRYEL